MNRELIRSKLKGRKVGVVIPCHNYGRYLEKCLDSILDQSIPPDRIVVVDDASTDNTYEICGKYTSVLYARVDFKHANKARNYGISLISDCDFLLLFDPDNYMMPMMIQNMLGCLIENPDAAYVYSDRIIIDEHDTIGKRVCFPKFNARRFESDNFVDFASLMHRKVYDAVGGFTEDAEFSALEDWDFFYAAANRGFNGIHIPESLYYYRFHPESLYYYRFHPESKSIYLKNNPVEFQKLKRRILERNYIGLSKTLPSVSFVFAARSEQEANATITEYSKQSYRGKVEYCYSTEGTIPQALNKALAMAKHDIVVFIETDVKPHNSDWLRYLLSGLKPGAMLFSDEVSHIWFNWAGTACYREDLHAEPLDESYPIAEDTEYFERLKLKHGLKLVRSDAVVYHVKEHETQKALERAKDYGYLHAKLMDEYHYYPLATYIQRLELQKQIAEQTLLGIKQYQDGKNTIR